MRLSYSTTLLLSWVSITSMLETIIFTMIPHFDIVFSKDNPTVKTLTNAEHTGVFIAFIICDIVILIVVCGMKKPPEDNGRQIVDPKTQVFKETITSTTFDIISRSFHHLSTIILKYHDNFTADTLSVYLTFFQCFFSLYTNFLLIISKPSHQLKEIKSIFYQISSAANSASVGISFTLMLIDGKFNSRNQGTLSLKMQKVESWLIIVVSIFWGLSLLLYLFTWGVYIFFTPENLGDLENGDHPANRHDNQNNSDDDDLPANDLQNQDEGPGIDMELEDFGNDHVDEPGNIDPGLGLNIHPDPPAENPREEIQLIQAGQGEEHHREDDNSDQDEAQPIGEGIERVGGADNIIEDNLPAHPEPNNAEADHQNIATGSTRSTSSSESRAIQRRQTHSSKQSSDHDERLETLFD
ncbi:hypothetical protein WICPIJ_005566 [Wickerhamomyces pijperi]|uniref:Uncharacterized protein n=1 Tax=Wickerhamomyces pijperi TaxID=599730 RepID=A0A9P8TLP9_WICPI|nr:hypothetical protein WICPIJ_005566 [Wickerhamomyces pijperi]